jgi:hypothetical protein
METEHVRDYAMYAAVFGIFGFSWFGWAQEDPPESWRIPLGIASAACFLIACAGGWLAFFHWRDASALSAPGAYERFGVVVGIEVFAAAAGALVLIFAVHKPEFVAAWVAFIVGVHFVPLSSIFQDRALLALAALVVLSSLASVVFARKLGVSTVTLTGVTTGVSLLIFAVRGLVAVAH